MIRAVSRFAMIALIIAIAALPGCLVIEKKTLIMVVPADSKKIHLYYLFEGLSVLDRPGSAAGNYHVDEAHKQLKDLQKSPLSFFTNGYDSANLGADHPFTKHFAVQSLRFYQDAKRPRSLCADREGMILDRDAFFEYFNDNLGPTAQRYFDGTPAEFKTRLITQKADLEKKDVHEVINGLGMQAILKVVKGLLVLADELDDDSIRKLQSADKFRWFRVEPGVIRLVIPMTAGCAKKIATSPKSADWLKDMRTFVEPLSMEPREDGLALVMGGTGKAIRLTISDPRPYFKELDEPLAKRVDSPPAIHINGQPTHGEILIDRFIGNFARKSSK